MSAGFAGYRLQGDGNLAFTVFVLDSNFEMRGLTRLGTQGFQFTDQFRAASCDGGLGQRLARDLLLIQPPEVPGRFVIADDYAAGIHHQHARFESLQQSVVVKLKETVILACLTQMILPAWM